jgi:hypothetical protein
LKNKEYLTYIKQHLEFELLNRSYVTIVAMATIAIVWLESNFNSKKTWGINYIQLFEPQNVL